MNPKTDKYKFPAMTDKFSEGVLVITQWLLDYYHFRDHEKDEGYKHITPLQFQNAMGKNCSTLANRYRGALLGLAVGDALGVPLEFQPRPPDNIITDIVGGGPFNLKSGKWTDDTSMALCMAHSLLRRHKFDPRDQMDLYVSWWRNGSFSSTGECFDIGDTVSAALKRYEETNNPMAGSTDTRSAGNGSLMRLAPVVLFYASHPDDALDFAAESSKTTHAATEAVDACRYFAGLILGALYGESKETILSANYTPEKRYWEFEPLTEKIKTIADGSYKNKIRDDIKSTGYVVDSLEAALWAFYNSRSFKEGAIKAVNLGGDADTIGAIYGQIAGAFYGETGIPFEWIGKIAYNHVFYMIADEMISFYSGKPIYK